MKYVWETRLVSTHCDGWRIWLKQQHYRWCRLLCPIRGASTAKHKRPVQHLHNCCPQTCIRINCYLKSWYQRNQTILNISETAERRLFPIFKVATSVYDESTTPKDTFVVLPRQHDMPNRTGIAHAFLASYKLGRK